MSIRELIKIKIINDLARELAKELNMEESDIPNLLSNQRVRDKIDLEAEHYLDSLHRKIIMDDLKNELNRIESCINQMKADFYEEVRREISFINKILVQHNIMNMIPNGNGTINCDRVQLKDLISKNETEQVIQIMLQVTKNKSSKIFNEVIVHYSKLQKLTTDCRIGTIHRENEMRERTKINHDLLQLVDEIEL